MTNLLGKPEIDLFASRLNNQLNQYVSWHPDPGAAFIDAFNLNWHNIQLYAFPPFSLIARCLQKCITDEAEGILITPLWPTQFWFPQLLQLIRGKPVMFPHHKAGVYMPTTPSLVMFPQHKAGVYMPTTPSLVMFPQHKAGVYMPTTPSLVMFPQHKAGVYMPTTPSLVMLL